MGSGGSPTQQYNFHDNPRAWQYSLQDLLSQVQDAPQYYIGADNNFANNQRQANNYYQQDPQTIGTGVIDFNQLAQQQTPTISQPYGMQQAPQSYVRSNIDLSQLYGQQPQQQSYTQPVQQPVQQSQPVTQQPVQQQQVRQGGVARSGNNAFNSTIQLVLKNEGGYTRFPSSLGGETNYGIIESTFKNAKDSGLIKSPDVKRLTKDDAIKIYRTNFWGASKAGQLPDALAGIYFDTYIQRPKTGGEILQRAINSFAGRNLVKVDSRVGQQTINTVNSLIKNNDDLRRFINIFCDERAARFRRVNGNKKNEAHLLSGYLKRNENSRKWALGQIGGNSAPARQQAPAQTQQQPQQQPQQAQAPQVTPGYPVDFSQDYMQDILPAKTYGMYPNYWDYVTSPEYHERFY